MQLLGWPLLAITVGMAYIWWPAAILTGAIFILVVSFFRDPPRYIPQTPGLFVSPADGKVIEIAQLEHDDFVGGPAVRLAIFLTLFNVHVNRMPCAMSDSLAILPRQVPQRQPRGSQHAKRIDVDRTGRSSGPLSPHRLPPGFRPGGPANRVRFAARRRLERGEIWDD